MTRKRKTTKVDPSASTKYWKKAQEFREAMVRALAAHQSNAAALNAIHCSISSVDALCVRLAGLRSASKEHSDAVRLLTDIFPHGEGRRQAERLGTILAKKNQVEYEDRLFDFEEADRLVQATERLFLWIGSQLGASSAGRAFD